MNVERYNRFVVLESWIEGKGNRGSYRVARCKCDCGTIKIVKMNCLRSGNTKSCGCLNLEKIVQRNYKHGFGNHQISNVYYSMLRRCENDKHSSFKHYGGRGIKVCDEWKNDIGCFIRWAEINGYEQSKQLDRINNDGNYEPSNCRFVTVDENHKNMRSNVYIDGVCLKDFLRNLSKQSKIPYSTLTYRYYRMKNNELEPTKDNLINYKSTKTTQANQLPIQ